MFGECKKVVQVFLCSLLILFIFLQTPFVKALEDERSEGIEEIPIDFNIAQEVENISVADHSSVVVCRLNVTSLRTTHSNGKFDLRDFNGNLCTHLVFSSFHISTLYKIVADDNIGQLKKAYDVVSKYPHLKLLLEISIDNFKTSGAKQNFLDKLTSSEEERSKFVGNIKHTLQVLKPIGFVGVQLDREFYLYAEKTGFALLAQELKEHFEKDDLLVTTEIEAHSKKRIDKYYKTSLADITKHFHLVFVRGYNLQNSDESTTAHLAPLHSSTPSDGSIQDILQYLLFHKNVNPANLVLDVPFFGRSHLLKHTTTTDKANGYAARTLPNGFPGPRFNANSIWGYNEICSSVEELNEDWKMYWDYTTQVPFIRSGNKWMSFENGQSIQEKVIMAKYFGLRGIMASNIDMDDFEGRCSDTRCPLLKSVSYALHNAAPLTQRYDSDNDNGDQETSTTNGNTMLTLATTTFAFLLILVVVAAFVIFKRLKSSGLSNAEIVSFMKGRKESGNSGDECCENQQELICPDNLPYDSSYEIPSSNFEIEKTKVLARGQFNYNVMYNGTIGNIPTAVKITKNGRDNVKLLLSELKTLIYIQKHKHVVTLLGASTTELKKGLLCVFLEVCPLGDLQLYLRSSKTRFVSLVENDTLTDKIPVVKEEGTKISTANLVDWSHQTAIALEYLRTKKIVHGLLSTMNIMMYEKNTVKLSDIGIFCTVYNRTKNNPPEPPFWRWLAVEVLEEEKFSTQSDVWSFGVTLWEIFSFAENPYSFLTWTPALPQLLKQNLRMQKPTCATKPLYNLMLDCWKQNPADRPTPKDLVIYFSKLWQHSHFTDSHLNITGTPNPETETTM